MNRTFLYHKDYPQGRIFDDEIEYEAEKDRGAVSSPAIINWEEEEEKPKKKPGRKPKVVKDDNASS